MEIDTHKSESEKPNIFGDKTHLTDKSNLKYWLYSPGENGELWEEFFNQGIMALGWDELGDLNNYSTKSELTKKLKELEKTEGSKKNDSTANYEFKDVISIGDIIIAKKGRGELLGYGVVVSEYYYDKERSRYQQCRKVDWKTRGNWKTGFNIVLKTLTDITKYKSDHPAYEKYYERLISLMFNKDQSTMQNLKSEFIDWLVRNPRNNYYNNDKTRIDRALDKYNEYFDLDIYECSLSNYNTVLGELDEKLYKVSINDFLEFSNKDSSHQPRAILGDKNYMKFLKDKFSEENKTGVAQFSAPLNKILYGPPGTGKTYNTLLLAAQIINRANDIAYKEARNVFNENLGSKIEFITFHQNYSYEDFIQGLRPEVETKGNLSFERKDGVFARIAINALFEYFKIYADRKRKLKTTDQNLDVNEVYLSFYNYLKSNPNQVFKTKTGSELTIKSYSERKCLLFNHSDSSVIHTVSGDRLIKLYEKFPSINKIKNVHKDITEVIGGCNATVYWTALNEFIIYYEKVKSQRKDIEKEDLINYDDISFEEKKEFLNIVDISELYKVSSNDVPNYVLIIDEINRANISRVFGELITLIEPDKRSHGELPLRCTLPSGETFIVPSNLHIIGTMNTAAKSIALLDIALRRRFEFEAMYPKYEIDGYEIYDITILAKINEEIIQSKGHDFQIGHAYFMGENKDLVQRMNKKVIPLLLEYYMNDKDEVEKILFNAGLEVDKSSWPITIIGKRV